MNGETIAPETRPHPTLRRGPVFRALAAARLGARFRARYGRLGRSTMAMRPLSLLGRFSKGTQPSATALGSAPLWNTSTGALVWLRWSAFSRRLRRAGAPNGSPASAPALPADMRASQVASTVERRVQEIHTLVERIRERVVLEVGATAARGTVGGEEGPRATAPQAPRQAAQALPLTGGRSPETRSRPVADAGGSELAPAAIRTPPPAAPAPTPGTRLPSLMPSRPLGGRMIAPVATHAPTPAVPLVKAAPSTALVPAATVTSAVPTLVTARKRGPSRSTATIRLTSEAPAARVPPARPQPSRAHPAMPPVVPRGTSPLRTAVAIPSQRRHLRGAPVASPTPFMPLATHTSDVVRGAPFHRPTVALAIAHTAVVRPRAPSAAQPTAAASVFSADARFPVAPHFSMAPVASPNLPPPSPPGALPLVPRPSLRKPATEPLPFLRRREKTVDVRQIQETVTRRIEETLHRRVIQDVESVVARELAPDGVLARRLGDRLYDGLCESLLLEKERVGWG